jgi:hypothetical protein
MSQRIRSSLGVPLLIALGCVQPQGATPPPADAPAKEVALAGAVVLIAAGDIAVCGEHWDEATAALVDSILKADSAANVENAVVTMGDNAYPSGSEYSNRIFQRCFTPSWGSKRIMNVIHPSPGNHDFENTTGDGYYRYFGSRAGPPGKGYYSFDIGDWHAVSLNSEILVDPGPFSPEAKAQEEWLLQDLKDHSKPCTLAYFHQPLFTSGVHGPTVEVEGVWNVLYANGVDLVLNGHEHHYERFLPQTPWGVADSVKGIEEIVAGTGGSALRGLRSPLAPNSVAQIHGHYGILKLTLGPGEYRHAFLDTDGRVWDRGGGKCH